MWVKDFWSAELQSLKRNIGEIERNNMELDRVYFAPGDLCKVRHNIDFVPTMWVVEKVTRNIKNKESGDMETMFLGIKCR